MILAGTDELGYLLSKEAELAAWRRRIRRASIPLAEAS